MTSKELQNKLYSVECSLDTVDSDISILLEKLNYEKKEMSKAHDETKGDKFVSHYLKEITFDLDDVINALNAYLETFRTRRSIVEEKTRLCARLVKGGIERNESE
jgi:predicted solute-binding protein